MTTRQRGSSIAKVVLKSGEPRWRFRVDVPGPDGERKQRTLTFTTERAAIEAQAATRTAVAAGTYTPPDRITVDQWFDQWLEIGQRTSGLRRSRCSRRGCLTARRGG